MLQILIQHMHVIGDELDEATCERIQERVGQLSQEMTWLLQDMQDLEQRTQEHSGFVWKALLFSALQQRQYWDTAGLLVLLLGICW